MNPESVQRPNLEPIYTDSTEPAGYVQQDPATIECFDGHRWTIKQLHRTETGDYVLLGQYIGPANTLS
jgi:hypothetical protein